MKTIGAWILAAMLILAGFQAAVAAPDQPHMRSAIELLQAAKKADKPLPMLNSAKRHIQKAKPNKGGERGDAAQAVNEAIAFATTGDKEKMEQKINHAIAQLHSGMAKAK